MTTNSRRHFLRRLAITAGSPLFLRARALAQETPAAPSVPVELLETDPLAMALGYKADATQVDASKYPQFKPGQICEGCALYTGTPGEASGPCTIFQHKLVAAKGWCATFAAKPLAAPAP